MLDEIPRSELSKLDGPATLDGDSLQVSMHNGTSWELREIVIGLTIIRRSDEGNAAANGAGSFVGNTWDLNTTPGDFAPAFSVNGSLAAATPEPSAIFLMLGGLAALRGLVARRKIILRPGSSEMLA